ncbi:HET domain containing protein [Hyaloscypha variabilis]
MAPFPYEKLKYPESEIRLLTLSRSSNGVVQCHTSQHSLDAPLHYFALSYVWGDLTVTQNILVDGKTFPATVNLVAALDSLSEEEGRAEYLWVDAICINQSDNEERNAQVAMMSSIYKKAWGVIAWLGPEEDRSTEVIEIMKVLAEEIGTDVNGVEILSKLAPRPLLRKLNIETSDTSLLDLVLPRMNDFIRLLSGRSFWTRAWILQELVLAQISIFLCGRTAFHYQNLENIGRWASSIRFQAKPTVLSPTDWLKFQLRLGACLEMPMRAYYLILKNDDTLRSAGPHAAAWEVFKFTWPLHATDPRDKVYSIAGLTHIGIKPDYSKPPEIVYHDLAAILLDKVGLGDWLARAGLGTGKKLSGLSTWVIDWDALSKGWGWREMVLDRDIYTADKSLFNGPNTPRINQKILTTLGALCDRIEFVAPFSDNTKVNAKEALIFDLTGGLNKKEILFTLVPPGIPRGQASLRLLVQDISVSERLRYTLTSDFVTQAMVFLVLHQLADRQGLAFQFEQDPKGWNKIFLGDNVPSSTLDIIGVGQETTYDPEKQPELVRRFAKHYQVARHFYTRNGHLGYGPKGIQKDDLICVLPNCQVPVILRQVDNHYHFVSTCFVLGLMDGEAAQMIERGESTIQNFNIH